LACLQFQAKQRGVGGRDEFAGFDGAQRAGGVAFGESAFRIGKQGGKR